MFSSRFASLGWVKWPPQPLSNNNSSSSNSNISKYNSSTVLNNNLSIPSSYSYKVFKRRKTRFNSLK